jgi:hypothetical protein
MLTRQEGFEQSKLPHHLERGRVNRITTKIAQKVGMLFEYDNINTGASKKVGTHYAGWAAAHDANAGVDAFGR